MVGRSPLDRTRELSTRLILVSLYLLTLTWWARTTLTPVLIPNFEIILKLMSAPFSRELDGEALHGSALSWIVGWVMSVDDPRELRLLFGIESVLAILAVVWSIGVPWRRNSIEPLVAMSTFSWVYVQFQWMGYDALTIFLLALAAGLYLRGRRLVYLAMLLLGLQHFEILLMNALTAAPLLWVRSRDHSAEPKDGMWRPRDLVAMLLCGFVARLGLSVTYGRLGVREDSRLAWVARRGLVDALSALDDGVWLGWSLLGLGWLMYASHMTIARPRERLAVALGPVVAMGVALFSTDHTRVGAMSLVWLSLLIARDTARHRWLGRWYVLAVLAVLTLLQPWIWVWEGRTVVSWWLR